MKSKIGPILFFLNLFCFNSLSWALVSEQAVNKAFNPPQKVNKKKKVKIPLKINLGFGLSRYRLFDVYDNENDIPNVYGSEFSLSGIVENPTIRRFKHKIPKEHRKLALRVKEISATSLYIPRTFYIHPLDSQGIESYGITWGFVPSIGMGLGPIRFFIRGGVILSYLFYRDHSFAEPIHFLRPGLRGGSGLRIHLFKSHFIVELGGKGDIYIPGRFYANQREASLWNIRGSYVLFHFRYPIEVQAEI